MIYLVEARYDILEKSHWKQHPELVRDLRTGQYRIVPQAFVITSLVCLSHDLFKRNCQGLSTEWTLYTIWTDPVHLLWSNASTTIETLFGYSWHHNCLSVCCDRIIIRLFPSGLSASSCFLRSAPQYCLSSCITFIHQLFENMRLLQTLRSGSGDRLGLKQMGMWSRVINSQLVVASVKRVVRSIDRFLRLFHQGLCNLDPKWCSVTHFLSSSWLMILPSLWPEIISCKIYLCRDIYIIIGVDISCWSVSLKARSMNQSWEPSIHSPIEKLWRVEGKDREFNEQEVQWKYNEVYETLVSSWLLNRTDWTEVIRCSLLICRAFGWFFKDRYYKTGWLISWTSVEGLKLRPSISLHQINSISRGKFREIRCLATRDSLNLKIVSKTELNLARFHRHPVKNGSFPPARRPFEAE